MATGIVFDTITEVQTVVGGAVAQSLELRAIAPYFELAYEKHLSEWIPAAFWTLIKTYPATTNNLPDLYPYIQKAIARLGLYEAQPYASVEWGSAGQYRVETEDRKGLYKYQETAFAKANLENGYEAIEQLLIFLNDNEDDYPLWKDKPGAKLHRSLTINTAADFRAVHSKKVNRFVFNSMRSEILEVEMFILPAHFGWDFYEEYKLKIESKAITGVWIELHTRVQRVIAHFAMRVALRRNIVNFDGEKVVKIEVLEPQGYQREGGASGTEIGSILRHFDDFGNRHISLLTKYLTDNIEETAFLKYKDFKEETAPTTSTVEEENDRLFCGCTSSCSCSAGGKSSGKAVFRL